MLGCVASAEAGTVPAGFDERPVIEGLSAPMAVSFAPGGQVFVAEKDGVVKLFDGLSDTTPTVFADLSDRVHSYSDRGLMGMALAPSYPLDPHVYISYTYDGTSPGWDDGCPVPVDGCMVSGRVSRLAPAGGVPGMGPATEQVLIEDWCQQYSSHSLGAVEFDSRGRLYVAGGEGANFDTTDWGQLGSTPNPCGDPPAPAGTALTPPTAEGGALRSQDLRTAGDPVGLGGTIIRIDPATGAGVSENPLFDPANPTANAGRIVATGLRNPFRFAISPTDEVWLGDVGWTRWEEINRFAAYSGPMPNFGWPCYEGGGRQAGYDDANLSICENLYAQPSVDAEPHFTYSHSPDLVSGGPCATESGPDADPISSASSGVEYYTGASFPAAYTGALFFADYARGCIWAMRRGTGVQPDPALVSSFDAGASTPVDLEVGPDGSLYYVDIWGGQVQRIRYQVGNQQPVAVASATPSSGAAPLTVNFDGTQSSDPDDDDLTYAWDLNGNGVYGDSSAAEPQQTYNEPGQVTVGLRVSDGLLTDTDAVTISAGNDPPQAQINTPAADVDWRVGQTISLQGSASDPQQGQLPGSALDWQAILHHCPGSCHEHSLQSFNNTAAASFAAPDHDYPAHLELRLTATDSGGLTDTASRILQPSTAHLVLDSTPAGLSLTLNSFAAAAPITATVIEGSQNTIAAPSPQTLGGVAYDWAQWSDRGAAAHTVEVGADATYVAAFNSSSPEPFPPGLGSPELERLKLKLPGTLRGLLRRGARALLRCDADCSVKMKVGGRGRRARRLNLDGTIARGHAALDDGVAEWVVATPTERAARKLAAEDPDAARPRLKASFSAGPAG